MTGDRPRKDPPAIALFKALGMRGTIGVFGGGGIATAGVVAAIAFASPGGSRSGGATEALVAPSPAPAVVAPTPKPKKAKPSGPTLHGAPPSFAPTESEAGVGTGGVDVSSGQSLGSARDASSPDAAARAASASGSSTSSNSGSTSDAGDGPAERGSSTGAGDAPAATAKIGATPEASALATSRAGALDRAEGSAATGLPTGGEASDGLATPPAPKAAKQVARHFAEAFVAYEVGGVDTHVRQVFGATGTKQLSKALLKRPPRQPDGVKVPRAKVVNVVAGPSRGKVYSVSVSLLRVDVTSELRLQMEKGVGKKWQVTNVLG